MELSNKKYDEIYTHYVDTQHTVQTVPRKIVHIGQAAYKWSIQKIAYAFISVDEISFNDILMKLHLKKITKKKLIVMQVFNVFLLN